MYAGFACRRGPLCAEPDTAGCRHSAETIARNSPGNLDHDFRPRWPWGQRFDHFTRRLGLDEARTLVIDSPFDYPGQTRLWIPDGLPEPRDFNYTDALLEQVPAGTSSQRRTGVPCCSPRIAR